MSKPTLSIQTSGLREFKGALEKLDKKLRAKVVRGAVNAGIKVFVAAMRQRVPENSGLLKKSLGRKSKTYRQGGIYVAIAGARSGFKYEVQYTVKDDDGKILRTYKRVQDPRNYAHLTDSDKPWVQPSFDATRAEAESTAIARMRVGLAAVANEVKAK